MKLHSYVVEHDYGFAPNPFYGVCTLATCKPVIRRCAAVGDYVIGTGCAKHRRSGYLVYFLRVEEITDFDAYWANPRFRQKRPLLRGSLMQAYGDNIYHKNPKTGMWQQANSFHSLPDGRPNPLNVIHDTGCVNVLVGNDYCYWGGTGPLIPPRFRDWQGIDVCHSGQGHKNKFPQELVASFVRWLRGSKESGCVGDPIDW